MSSSDQPYINIEKNYEAVSSQKDVKFSLINFTKNPIQEKNDNNDTSNDDDKDVKLPELCIECNDVIMEGVCNICEDPFCVPCFQSQHRYGNRSKHKLIGLRNELINTKELEFYYNEKFVSTAKNENFTYEERAKWIPLRLSYEERIIVNILNAAFHLSDYTTKADNLDMIPSRRITTQIREINALLSGMIVADDYQMGQQFFNDGVLSNYEKKFNTIFEIGRRYKINNPEKMRYTFSKLIYLLQDTVTPQIENNLNFSCISPIKTVYNFLEERDALDILRDPLIEIATREISSRGIPRSQVQYEIRQKENTQKILAIKYRNRYISTEELQLCMYSIGDNNSFLKANRDSCDEMINYLKKYFNPDVPEEGYILTIHGGKDGARLSHSHKRHYHYVLQSLTLWREILNDTFKLWFLAEQDLLDPNNPYRLEDTGQGVHRIQSSPRVSRLISQILSNVQKQVKDWVGSSIIHFGDHNVPNALFFLTKYMSISPILNPILLCLEKIDSLQEDERVAKYIELKGGVDTIKKEILCDFFKHAFDGSGADNFFDAGSCIDGRLTSAWNWCNKIETKSFFPIFLLTEFVGFEGSFS